MLCAVRPGGGPAFAGLVSSLAVSFASKTQTFFQFGISLKPRSTCFVGLDTVGRFLTVKWTDRYHVGTILALSSPVNPWD